MANAYFYTNIAVPTTLSGNITNSATSATVGATTGWPGSFPFIIGLDFGAANEELVSVTANAAGTLTIVRGFGGTSAVSHSAGAVVRHVANAVDFTDFRTHEASTGSVHGLTGSIVGTSDTQTLTNKTINGGVVTGTFTGAAAFTGGITVSGGPILAGDTSNGTLSGTWGGAPTFLGTHSYTGATAGTNAITSRVTGDANARFTQRVDGQMGWGPGTTAVDTVLYRDGSNALGTDDLIRIYRTLGTDAAISGRRSGDTGARWYITADGVLSLGDGAGLIDVNLYRGSADTLSTDDKFDAQVETETLGLVAATDFTTTTFEARRTCNVATVHVVLSYTGATITANAAGNIVDTLCCTLPAGYRPAYFSTNIYDKSGIANGGVAVATDGTCTLKTLSPTATIASGNAIDFSASFVL